MAESLTDRITFIILDWLDRNGGNVTFSRRDDLIHKVRQVIDQWPPLPGQSVNPEQYCAIALEPYKDTWLGSPEEAIKHAVFVIGHNYPLIQKMIVAKAVKIVEKVPLPPPVDVREPTPEDFRGKGHR